MAAALYDFVEVTPSAITELMRWQNRSYPLIAPRWLKRNCRLKTSVKDK